jgi:F-type H+-transporting ATPase subunit delta
VSASGAESMGEVYAGALAQAAEEKGQLVAVGEEMAAFAKVWDERKDVRDFFLSGAVQKDAKKKALEKSLRGKASDLLADFLQVLLHRDRLWLLEPVAESMRRILDRRGNRVPVTITTATPLAPEQVDAIVARLRASLGKEPVVTQEVKPGLIGGAVLRVGDVVADGSVRRKLSELRSRIVRSAESAVSA